MNGQKTQTINQIRDALKLQAYRNYENSFYYFELTENELIEYLNLALQFNLDHNDYFGLITKEQ